MEISKGFCQKFQGSGVTEFETKFSEILRIFQAIFKNFLAIFLRKFMRNSQDLVTGFLGNRMRKTQELGTYFREFLSTF